MGQYWKPGELAVNIDPVVIDYLTNAKPKKLLDIVAAGQITGDSWQAYAWRWGALLFDGDEPQLSTQLQAIGNCHDAGGSACDFRERFWRRGL